MAQDLNCIPEPLRTFDGRLSLVNAAYVTPPAVVASMPSHSTISLLARQERSVTPSFTARQGIFSPASIGGMGVNGVRNYSGALGDDIKVFDIEYSWNPQHEDFNPQKFLPVIGKPVPPVRAIGDDETRKRRPSEYSAYGWQFMACSIISIHFSSFCCHWANPYGNMSRNQRNDQRNELISEE